MTNATPRGMSDAVNPHVRFDGGKVASVKMRRRVVFSSAFFLLLLASMSVEAGTVKVAWRDPSDVRAWEVLADPNEGVRWLWADDATAATLTVSNVLTGAVSSSDYNRGAGHQGEATLPVSAGLSLVELTLTQKNGQAVFSTSTARLRTGASVADIYADKTEKGYQRMRTDRIFAWSADWTTASGDISVETSCDSGELSSRSLPTSSGHDVLTLKGDFAGYCGMAVAKLVVGDKDAYESDLKVGNPGLTIIFR